VAAVFSLGQALGQALAAAGGARKNNATGVCHEIIYLKKI